MREYSILGRISGLFRENIFKKNRLGYNILQLNREKVGRGGLFSRPPKCGIRKSEFLYSSFG